MVESLDEHEPRTRATIAAGSLDPVTSLIPHHSPDWIYIMNYMKRIICLANSRKMSGRCVAGFEIGADRIGEWIRPVSDRPSEEISLADRRFKDGSDPATQADYTDLSGDTTVEHSECGPLNGSQGIFVIRSNANLTGGGTLTAGRRYLYNWIATGTMLT